MPAEPTVDKNSFTFSGTKYPICKQEHAKKDSHCTTQQELPQLQ